MTHRRHTCAGPARRSTHELPESDQPRRTIPPKVGRNRRTLTRTVATMLCTIVILYIASALLPLAGLTLLFLRARQDSKTLAKIPMRDDGKTSYEQVEVLVTLLREQTESRPKAVMRDFIFIGVGIGAATVASLLALTL